MARKFLMLSVWGRTLKDSEVQGLSFRASGPLLTFAFREEGGGGAFGLRWA